MDAALETPLQEVIPSSPACPGKWDERKVPAKGTSKMAATQCLRLFLTPGSVLCINGLVVSDPEFI